MPGSTGSISLSEITIASIFVESALYGIFISLYTSSTNVLLNKLRRSSSSTIHKRLLFVSTLMFILATMHVAADLRRIFDGFIVHKNSEGGSDRYFLQVNTAVYMVKSVAWASQTLVGDAFILYRLYLVWGGDMRVVTPIMICVVASVGVVIGGLRAFSRTTPSDPIFVKELQQWIGSFFSLTLFTNLASTILIAGRIWWTRRQIREIQVHGRTLSPAVILVIESGAIYSISLALLLSLYLSGNYVQYIALDAVTQITGLVFSLVIVRVALGISSDAATTTRGTSRTNVRGDIEDRTGSDNTEVATDGMIYALKPLRVEVNTVRDMRTDSRE